MCHGHAAAGQSSLPLLVPVSEPVLVGDPLDRAVGVLDAVGDLGVLFALFGDDMGGGRPRCVGPTVGGPRATLGVKGPPAPPRRGRRGVPLGVLAGSSSGRNQGTPPGCLAFPFPFGLSADLVIRGFVNR